MGFFTNRLIWLGIAIEWALILAIIYSPTLQKIFVTAALQPSQLLLLLICPPLILMADELRKRIVRQTPTVVFEHPIQNIQRQ
ncbi:MAG: cation transporting ATPase C-terminal domain-containing protein [Nostoc sp.]